MIEVEVKGKNYRLTYIEHIIHHTNLDNVFLHGIMSHNKAYENGFIQRDISMDEVQARRHMRRIRVLDKRYFVHDFVSFYFNSKNPMLYRRKDIQDELVIILINADIILKTPDKSPDQWAIYSNGNAASKATKFYYGNSLPAVPLDLIFSGSWNDPDEEIKSENKRKMCSEVLIYPIVYTSDIRKIICPNDDIKQYVNNLKSRLTNVDLTDIDVEIGTGYFFK